MVVAKQDLLLPLLRKFLFVVCFDIKILWLGGKNCVVKNKKQIIFPESQFVNLNPV